MNVEFQPGLFHLRGDADGDTIVLSTDAEGAMLLNGQRFAEGPATGTPRRIEIDAGAGHDIVDLSGLRKFWGEVVVHGGAGDDQLLASTSSASNGTKPTGSPRLQGLRLAVDFHGDDGDDLLVGGFGADRLSGGAGDDELVGGPGGSADFLRGDAGADTFTPDWSPSPGGRLVNRDQPRDFASSQADWFAPARTDGLSSRTPAQELPFTFGQRGVSLQNVPDDRLPFVYPFAIALENSDLNLQNGVVKFKNNGVYHDHPSRQALHAFQAINGFQKTQSPAYLARAEAQVQYLVAHAVKSRGALYYPFPFDFSRVAAQTIMKAPWYSAMTQGQVLAALCRLFQATGKIEYADAALATFRSFKNLPAPGKPWTVLVDSSRFVWFEEYPSAVPDRVMNGHVFALFGLIHYFRLTGDASCLRLIEGGLATAKAYYPMLRTPGWLSRTAFGYNDYPASYHQLQIDQLNQLYGLTRDWVFRRTANLLEKDYQALSASLTFEGGTYFVFRLNANGSVADQQIRYFIPKTRYRTTARRTLSTGQAWYLLDSGAFKGLWVRTELGGPGFTISRLLADVAPVAPKTTRPAP